jgi:hypothetical protein
VRNGKHNHARLDRDPRGHLYTGANLYMNPRAEGGYGRACRACTLASKWAGRRRSIGETATPEEVREYADARYAEIMAAA